MTEAEKITSFAERFIALRLSFKADVATLTDQAKDAEVDMPALRRLVSWMGKDELERQAQEAVDDQYRFLAGLLPAPAELPAESQLATAAALYADKMTIRAVAKEMGVSVGKAHALKIQAAAFSVQPKMNMNTRPTQPPGPDTPVCEGAGTTDKPDGPGSALATPSCDGDGSAPTAAGKVGFEPTDPVRSLPAPGAFNRSATSPMPQPEEHSTEDPWDAAMAAKAKVDALKAARRAAP